MSRRVGQSRLRAAAVALTIAVVLSFATAQAMVRSSCSESTVCAQGTALEGFEIECACLGPGSCWVEDPGHEVRCACEEHEVTICDCENGCN
jgi:hypothetical protein